MRAAGFQPWTESPCLKGGVWLCRWLTAPFVDGQEGLSLTRFISIYFAFLVGVSVEKQGGVITWTALWMAMISAAIAFGKSTFTFLLRRVQLGSVTSDVTQTIRRERDPALGVDPA